MSDCFAKILGTHEWDQAMTRYNQFRLPHDITRYEPNCERHGELVLPVKQVFRRFLQIELFSTRFFVTASNNTWWGLRNCNSESLTQRNDSPCSEFDIMVLAGQIPYRVHSFWRQDRSGCYQSKLCKYIWWCHSSIVSFEWLCVVKCCHWESGPMTVLSDTSFFSIAESHWFKSWKSRFGWLQENHSIDIFCYSFPFKITQCDVFPVKGNVYKNHLA